MSLSFLTEILLSGKGTGLMTGCMAKIAEAIIIAPAHKAVIPIHEMLCHRALPFREKLA